MSNKETFGFYPVPRFVVTKYDKELSWLFYKLVDIFLFKQKLLDTSSKIEFFGRLANAANLYISRLKKSSENCEGLLKNVLNEAFDILDQMQDGKFYSYDFLL